MVNKRFQATKFREGYDQDEVDDFLDEVVVELRRLNQENDELRQRLSAAEARASEAAKGAPPRRPRRGLHRAGRTAAHRRGADPGPAAPQSELDEQTSTTNLLQLARRLHEEHVREGIEKRDALIAERHRRARRRRGRGQAACADGHPRPGAHRSRSASTSCASSSATTA